jgi:hypothetical protein
VHANNSQIVFCSPVFVNKWIAFAPLFTSATKYFLFLARPRRSFFGMCQQKATQMDCILFSGAAKFFGICKQKLKRFSVCPRK